MQCNPAPQSDFRRKELLNGVNVITGKTVNTGGKESTFTAVPYYAMGNRSGKGNKVWLPVR
ncbi:hypothetical protein GCM10010967_31510 [Dyadobacter beijingensis]|uniref:Non-reducing end beta-L-arabinofuranosidase-like GH127 C-terminal domain-containing protein n=1 Tax=Dyadobacter beijingensis TaxID=365489 RepID=A0ABQ2HYZ7_9BACT|nr:hypothetical protein [Dyadobacter beijingensis]GGM95742.1 hypothetical protein GCM10010967_31510 [Dyadobacter beijingensis]